MTVYILLKNQPVRMTAAGNQIGSHTIAFVFTQCFSDRKYRKRTLMRISPPSVSREAWGAQARVTLCLCAVASPRTPQGLTYLHGSALQLCLEVPAKAHVVRGGAFWSDAGIQDEPLGYEGHHPEGI